MFYSFLLRHYKSVDALVSLLGFLSGLVPLTIFLLCIIPVSKPLFYLYLFVCVSISVLSLFLFYINNRLLKSHEFFLRCPMYSNFSCGCLLGFIFSVGFGLFCASVLSYISPIYWSFGLYLCLLSFFHWSEFYFTGLFNPTNCGLDVYMLTHSTEYMAACLFSFLEFWVEAIFFYYFPYQKVNLNPIKWFGLLMCLLGELLRKMALIRASTNFSHFIEYRKRKNHQLVKDGVYSWFRHPAYVGWYCWCVGTQILLLNPICIVGYAIASFKFFKDRIYEEEKLLLQFFGLEYKLYQQRVGTGLPFIKGYLE